jgi:hypothetical protein
VNDNKLNAAQTIAVMHAPATLGFAARLKNYLLIGY